MRIVIDMGHTPTSPGASGYLDELTCDREAGKRIIAELERRGHTVYDSTPADSVAYPQEVNQRVAYANSLANIDLFCSLHLNAGGGTGAEVLYYPTDTDGASYAAELSRRVANALGIVNRGAKPNDWVGVVCNVRHTAVLIEFCFVDTYADAQAWHACAWETLVNAVCDGIEQAGGGSHYDDTEVDVTLDELMNKNISTADSGNIPLWQAWSWAYTYAMRADKKCAELETKVAALEKKIANMTTGNVDVSAIAKAVNDDAAKRMKA